MKHAADERSELEIIKIQSEQRRVALEYWVSEKSRANDALKKAKAENQRLAARLAELEKWRTYVEDLQQDSRRLTALSLLGYDSGWIVEIVTEGILLNCGMIQHDGALRQAIDVFLDAAKEGSGDE